MAKEAKEEGGDDVGRWDVSIKNDAVHVERFSDSDEQVFDDLLAPEDARRLAGLLTKFADKIGETEKRDDDTDDDDDKSDDDDSKDATDSKESKEPKDSDDDDESDDDDDDESKDSEDAKDSKESTS